MTTLFFVIICVHKQSLSQTKMFFICTTKNHQNENFEIFHNVVVVDISLKMKTRE